MTEPILARVFRVRYDDKLHVVVHTVDGGAVVGQVIDVSDDGTIVTILGERDEYMIDVDRVCVIQTARRT